MYLVDKLKKMFKLKKNKATLDKLIIKKMNIMEKKILVILLT